MQRAQFYSNKAKESNKRRETTEEKRKTLNRKKREAHFLRTKRVLCDNWFLVLAQKFSPLWKISYCTYRLVWNKLDFSLSFSWLRQKLMVKPSAALVICWTWCIYTQSDILLNPMRDENGRFYVFNKKEKVINHISDSPSSITLAIKIS